MNFNILPRKEELNAITNKKSTFYGCGFNVNFENLGFEKKLKIVNDLVRQSILTDSNPNPTNETETLIGNCHTAALVSIEYLKYLGLGKNYKYVLCRRRQYDPEDITTRHAAVILEDDSNNKYFFDATPYVASEFGSVIKLDNARVYDEYEPLNGEKAELIFFIKEFNYKWKNNIINKKDIPFYLYVLKCAENYKMFNGFVSQCYEELSLLMDNKTDADRFMLKSFELNPYNKNNENNVKKQELRNKLINAQIALWKEELRQLLFDNINPERQLYLAQNIFQESKFMNDSLENRVYIYNKNMRMSNLTPRFFWEHGLNTIMIKPSAYYAGVRATIRERFLTRGNGAIYEYFTNLSKPTKTGIIPMIFSHTLGDEYIRSMNGTADIILLEGNSKILYNKKKALRNELCKNIINKEVMWSDNEKILWHPFVTNLIHSTDNPSEASMHFMIGYPEQQVMTRFMYPNPKFETEKER